MSKAVSVLMPWRDYCPTQGNENRTHLPHKEMGVFSKVDLCAHGHARGLVVLQVPASSRPFPSSISTPLNTVRATGTRKTKRYRITTLTLKILS